MKPTVDSTKWFQFLLALMVYCVVGCAMAILLTQTNIPETNKTLLTYMLGNIMGIAMAVTSFYFPSSVGSAKKDDTITTLAQAVTTAQQLPAPIAPIAPAEGDGSASAQ